MEEEANARKNVQDQNSCQKVWENGEDANLGGHDLVKKNGQTREWNPNNGAESALDMRSEEWDLNR